MRILSVLTQKPFGTGSGTYMSGVIDALRQSGQEQAVVAGLQAGESMPWQDEPNIKTYPVYYGTSEVPFPVVGMSDQMPYVSTLYRDLDEEMEQTLKTAFHGVLQQAVEEFRPELILCHHLYLLTAWVREWCPKLPVYGICHGSDLRQYQQTDKWREQIQAAVRKLDRVYALHQVQKEQIGNLFGREQVSILGSAIDQQVFRMEKEERQDITDVTEKKRKSILYVGKLSRSKGVLSLLRALERLPDSRKDLQVILAGGPGNPEEMETIRKQIADSSYRVVCPGFVDKETVAKLYQRTDCFVLPSFYEGLPLVIYEARACGAPVVCSDLPGVRQWSEEQIPDHHITFVKMPRMIGTDEPDPEDVSTFEERLAGAIEEKLTAGRKAEPPADLRALTWPAVAKRLVEK